MLLEKTSNCEIYSLLSVDANCAKTCHTLHSKGLYRTHVDTMVTNKGPNKNVY